MAKKNYYQILGIEDDASEQEIRDAYRSMARKFHPDSGSIGSSEEIFQRISEAYHVLSNPVEKDRYDLKNNLNRPLDSTLNLKKAAKERLKSSPFGKLDEDNPGTFGDPASRSKFPKRPDSGLFKKIIDKLKGSSNFGEKSQEDEEIRGEREYQFSIDALESLRGCERELAIRSGDRTIVIPVQVPRGLSENDVLNVVAPSPDPAIKSTTLKVRIKIMTHPIFDREGSNIIIKVPVTIGEALGGCEVELPVTDGSIRVKIPPQDKTCKRLRIRGKGIQDRQGNFGDLFVEPIIVLPDRVNDSVLMAGDAIDQGYLRNIRKDIPQKI